MIFDIEEEKPSPSPAKVVPPLLLGGVAGSLAGLIIWNPIPDVENGSELFYLFAVA